MNSGSDQILVLEDEPAAQKVLKHWLSNAGFQVTIAATSVDALCCARKQQFDLVIADYHLPDYLGTDFLKLLRRIPSYERIPAITVTARADELDKQRLRRKLQLCRSAEATGLAHLNRSTTWKRNSGEGQYGWLSYTSLRLRRLFRAVAIGGCVKRHVSATGTKPCCQLGAATSPTEGVDPFMRMNNFQRSSTSNSRLPSSGSIYVSTSGSE